jgi:hypothetical protein
MYTQGDHLLVSTISTIIHHHVVLNNIPTTKAIIAAPSTVYLEWPTLQFKVTNTLIAKPMACT